MTPRLDPTAPRDDCPPGAHTPSGPAAVTARHGLPRWIAMTGLASSMFLVIMDATMVNIAGRSIRTALELSPAGLALVVDSYLVAFAGLLLLGGRLADVLGGRRMFLGGMGLYLVATACCALATDGPALVAGRIVQGVAAAAVLPAALSLVLALHPTAAERARAMGVWGAVAGLGSLVGVFLGGTLTGTLGWQAVFLAPVPFGLIGGALVWWSAPSTRGTPGRFDALGAATITLGIAALAYGMLHAAEAGWGSVTALVTMAVGAASLVAFVLVEQRAARPLVPLMVFRRRRVVTANVVMLLLGGTLTSLFFFLPVYQQDVLGMDAITTGFSQVPLAGMIIVASGLAPLLAGRIGAVRTMRGGLLLLFVGFGLLALDPTTQSFSVSLLIAFLLIGTGFGFASVNAIALAVRESTAEDAGLLSGLINAAQQLGGGVGLATVAGVGIGLAGADGSIGFTVVFLCLAAFAVIALLVTALGRIGRGGS